MFCRNISNIDPFRPRQSLYGTVPSCNCISPSTMSSQHQHYLAETSSSSPTSILSVPANPSTEPCRVATAFLLAPFPHNTTTILQNRIAFFSWFHGMSNVKARTEQMSSRLTNILVCLLNELQSGPIPSIVLFLQLVFLEVFTIEALQSRRALVADEHTTLSSKGSYKRDLFPSSNLYLHLQSSKSLQQRRKPVLSS